MPPHGADRAQLQTAVTGTAAMVLVLCLSRWGTTFGVGSLYLTDILIGIAVINAAFTHRASGRFPGVEPRSWVTAVPVVHWLLLADVTIRAALSFDPAVASDWVRDLVPYLYGFLAVMSAVSFLAADVRRRERTARVFTAALILHLVWNAAIMLTPLGADFALKDTIAGATLFQVRPDIDSALNAVLAGICLRMVLRRRRTLLALIGLIASSGLVLSLATRAGTLSLIAVLCVSFGLAYARTPRTKSRGWLVLMAGVLILVVLAVLPATTPGQRIVATLLPDTATTGQQFNAQGTEAARNLVWRGVIGWTAETPARAVFGSGFGNDFLAESHTLQYLEGTTYTGVRSPHDYFIGSFARIGLIGVILIGACLLTGLIALIRRRYDIARDPLAPIAATIVVAIIPIASLGVVLEAPFGAVPLFWALGVLYVFRGRRPERDQVTPVEARRVPVPGRARGSRSPVTTGAASAERLQ